METSQEQRYSQASPKWGLQIYYACLMTFLLFLTVTHIWQTECLHREIVVLRLQLNRASSMDEAISVTDTHVIWYLNDMKEYGELQAEKRFLRQLLKQQD
jgi:hypothetical protein